MYKIKESYSERYDDMMRNQMEPRNLSLDDYTGKDTHDVHCKRLTVETGNTDDPSGEKGR